MNADVHHHHRRGCRAAALDPGSDRGDARRLPRSRRGQGGQPAAAALQRRHARSGAPLHRQHPRRRGRERGRRLRARGLGVHAGAVGRRPQGQRRRRRQLHRSSSSTTCAPASRSPSCTRPISRGCASARPRRWRCRSPRARTPRCSACSAPACRRCRTAGPSARCGRSSASRCSARTPAHRAAFVKQMAGEKFETIAVDDPREVVRGAHVVACTTNSKLPVLNGEWLEARADGRHHRQFRRHQRPPRGRRDHLRARERDHHQRLGQRRGQPPGRAVGADRQGAGEARERA